MFSKIYFVLSIILLSFSTVYANDCNDRYISMTKLRESLPKQPINVGFDVDNTIIATGSCFLSFIVKNDGTTNTEFLQSIIQDPATQLDNIWHKCNGEMMNFSMPKSTGMNLIKLHKERGDKIYFITARPYTENEQLSAYIKNVFNIEDVSLHFAGKSTVSAKPDAQKEMLIKKYNITLFYGDSDGDIKSARKAKIRPIRILTPYIYSPKELKNFSIPLIPYSPNPGIFCEEILQNSWH